MTTYYHVCENWNGMELESLVSQHGESDAIELFVERWPDAVNVAYEHSSRIHLHVNLQDAVDFQDCYGGDILEINLDEDAVEECCIITDYLEYPHPVACENIPAEYIKRSEK